MKYYIHVLIILLAIGLTGCGPESGEVRIDIEALLAKPKTFVGSDKCEFCHLEHYNSWKKTLHSRTLQDVTENLDALVADIDPLIIRVDLKRIEKSLRVPVEKIYIPKMNEVKYTIGMQWEQGFLVEKNGTLYVAPIQYSAREEHWIAYHEKDWDLLKLDNQSLQQVHPITHLPGTISFQEAESFQMGWKMPLSYQSILPMQL